MYVAWNESDKNSYLSTSGGQKLLGYGFPSVSAATSAGVSFVNEMPTALYHYRKNADGDVDDFYTINPAVEVNLSGGPIPPREARQGEYVYQGIFYMFGLVERLETVKESKHRVKRTILAKLTAMDGINTTKLGQKHVITTNQRQLLLKKGGVTQIMRN